MVENWMKRFSGLRRDRVPPLHAINVPPTQRGENEEEIFTLVPLK